MRLRQGAVLESLRRVQGYLAANGKLLEPVIESTGKQLGDSIDSLTAHAVSQDGGARGVRGETARQRTLRTTLRFTHLRPIAEIAKLKLRDVPQFHALAMPPSNATVQRMLAAAGAMADAAAPHVEVLVASGLPSDFLAKLRAAAEAVKASIAGRSAHSGARSGATAGLAAEEKRGRMLLSVLDSLVTPLLGSDDRLLAEWRTAKQVRRKSGPPMGAAAPEGKPAATALHIVPPDVLAASPPPVGGPVVTA